MAQTCAVRKAENYLPNILFLKIILKDKECEDYEDSKCRFWTYVPTRRLCFLLSSCSEKDEAGIVSAQKGCIVPSSKITAFNLCPDKAVQEIKIEWEFKTVCPDVEIAELAALKSQELTYFEKPDSLKCGKLKKVSGKMGDGMGAVDCTALDNVDPANFYIKPDLAKSGSNSGKCVIETTPKSSY